MRQAFERRGFVCGQMVRITRVINGKRMVETGKVVECMNGFVRVRVGQKTQRVMIQCVEAA